MPVITQFMEENREDLFAAIQTIRHQIKDVNHDQRQCLEGVRQVLIAFNQKASWLIDFEAYQDACSTRNAFFALGYVTGVQQAFAQELIQAVTDDVLFDSHRELVKRIEQALHDFGTMLTLPKGVQANG